MLYYTSIKFLLVTSEQSEVAKRSTEKLKRFHREKRANLSSQKISLSQTEQQLSSEKSNSHIVIK